MYGDKTTPSLCLHKHPVSEIRVFRGVDMDDSDLLRHVAWLADPGLREESGASTFKS